MRFSNKRNYIVRIITTTEPTLLGGSTRRLRFGFRFVVDVFGASVNVMYYMIRAMIWIDMCDVYVSQYITELRIYRGIFDGLDFWMSECVLRRGHKAHMKEHTRADHNGLGFVRAVFAKLMILNFGWWNR